MQCVFEGFQDNMLTKTTAAGRFMLAWKLAILPIYLYSIHVVYADAISRRHVIVHRRCAAHRKCR